MKDRRIVEQCRLVSFVTWSLIRWSLLDHRDMSVTSHDASECGSPYLSGQVARQSTQLKWTDEGRDSSQTLVGSYTRHLGLDFLRAARFLQEPFVWCPLLPVDWMGWDYGRMEKAVGRCWIADPVLEHSMVRVDFGSQAGSH